MSARRRKNVSPGRGFTRLSEVPEQRVRWWWAHRLPWGTVSLLAGDGGMGKSTLAQELGARMTRGESPPGSSASQPRGVVLLTAEESLSMVIRPRMEAMGADLDRVVLIDHDDEEWADVSLPGDLDRVEEECHRADAGLLIIDSGPAFLDQGLSGNAEADIRTLLRPLARLAERRDLIVLVLVHLNKKTGTTASTRVMGGAAWRNAARTVLFMTTPEEANHRTTDERLVIVEKSNLGIYPRAQAVRIVPFDDDPDRAGIAWDGEHDADIEDLLSSAHRRPAPKTEDAKDFLRAALLMGPRLAKEVEAEADAEGIAAKTLRTARKQLGVRSVPPTEMGGPWTWALDGEEQS